MSQTSAFPNRVIIHVCRASSGEEILDIVVCPSSRPQHSGSYVIYKGTIYRFLSTSSFPPSPFSLSSCPEGLIITAIFRSIEEILKVRCKEREREPLSLSHTQTVAGQLASRVEPISVRLTKNVHILMAFSYEDARGTE